MENALKSWELENAVALVDSERDALYSYDTADQKAVQNAKPWKNDPHHFQKVRISAVALLKMVMHARSGGNLEIMGLMQGKVEGDTFIVTDSFRLPVEGTETRVNAQAEADEYMIQYLESARAAGQIENLVGWYHSHPGYGCWLSGIDVSTQMIQQLQGPFLAVVIDPDRTISAGKVDIGAFRTFPEDYKPPASKEDDGYQAIPLAKIEDFGAHSSRYYSLDISHFKSSLDSHLLGLLWNKYWVSTLSQSPLFTNKEFSRKKMIDLSQKIRRAEDSIKARARSRGQFSKSTHGKDNLLEKIAKDSNAICSEELSGLMASVVKERLFGDIGQSTV